MTSTSLTLGVLSAYYHSRVSTLLDYLIETIDCHCDILHDDAGGLLTHLLSDNDEANAIKNTKLKLSQSTLSMTEVIDRAQVRMFAKSKGKPSNVITSGYRSAQFRSEAGKGGVNGRQGITNFFVNTMVTALQSPEWDILLKRVGDLVISHLLTETSIFVPLPNDCFCQLTGPPLIFRDPPQMAHLHQEDTLMSTEKVPSLMIGGSAQKRKAEIGDADYRSLKRYKTNRPAECPPVRKAAKANAKTGDVAILNRRSASDIPIARISLFYIRPCRQPKTNCIILGLPSSHILNRMKTHLWRKERGLMPDEKGELKPGDRDGAFEARHLSKYIFPLQYALDNAFFVSAEVVKHEQFERGRFADREVEITSKSACRTPVRLKKILPLMTQIFQRHQKCGYKPLLDKICPSKLKPGFRDSTIDSSIILELVSEEITESQLNTQMIVRSYPTISDISGSVSMHGGTLARAQSKLKPKFADFICSHIEVFLFVRAITKAVIPFVFWGCSRNRKVVLQHVKQFISNRRFEGLTLHNVMQGMSTSECDWLLPPGNISQHPGHSMPESLKRRELLEEFLFWYFDQFLLPLLRTTFYITESSAFRNRVLYFRQDDWDILCQPLLDRLASTTFQRIHQHEAEELLQQRKLGYSFVRLLPKDRGVRPIVNLRRKKKKTINAYEQSINQILAGAFHILTYEKKMQAEQLGASVFGPNEIYLKLKEYKKRILRKYERMPKFYFVKVDVLACFDTIEQSKLLEIIKDLISEDAYMIRKYGQIIPTVGKIKRTYVKKALPEYEHAHFLTYATQLASLLRHAILVDQVVYPFAYRDDIIQLLEDHITSNIVKIGQDYYRQSVGIPQGSVLSSLLCSFFYGDLERSALRFTTESENNMLLRLIDDYLFVTTSLDDACRFLEVMNKGHPEYGCFISKDKTLQNFEYLVADVSQINLSGVLHPDTKLFPWCGYLINTEDLSVMADYSRFHDNYLMDSLTVERCHRPNSAFAQKMLETAKAKSHIIFTDTSLSSADAVHTNIHQAFVLAAMKMHAYIRAAGNVGGLAFVPVLGREGNVGGIAGKKNKRKGGAFLLDVIRQSIHYTYASIKNKASGRIAKEAGSTCDVQKDAVIWLGAHAFHSILSIKRTAYAQAGVLSALHGDLVHPRYRGVQRRFRKLAEKSLKAMLCDIQF